MLSSVALISVAAFSSAPLISVGVLISVWLSPVELTSVPLLYLLRRFRLLCLYRFGLSSVWFTSVVTLSSVVALFSCCVEFLR